ncbi:hypothetical protein CSB37_02640 [bacterium DOLZORAL124_38_8]|nr:MAG: hypothetical protein CSB37_02640 [bacterium DOLZORAL124_38_8]
MKILFKFQSTSLNTSFLFKNPEEDLIDEGTDSIAEKPSKTPGKNIFEQAINLFEERISNNSHPQITSIENTEEDSIYNHVGVKKKKQPGINNSWYTEIQCPWFIGAPTHEIIETLEAKINTKELDIPHLLEKFSKSIIALRNQFTELSNPEDYEDTQKQTFETETRKKFKNINISKLIENKRQQQKKFLNNALRLLYKIQKEKFNKKSAYDNKGRYTLAMEALINIYNVEKNKHIKNLTQQIISRKKSENFGKNSFKNSIEGKKDIIERFKAESNGTPIDHILHIAELLVYLKEISFPDEIKEKTEQTT